MAEGEANDRTGVRRVAGGSGVAVRAGGRTGCAADASEDQAPKLTVARALFIRLMDQYAAQCLRLTLLESQNWLLSSRSGQPLKLITSGLTGRIAQS